MTTKQTPRRCPDCGGPLEPEPHPYCAPCVWRDMSCQVIWCGRADETLPAHDGGGSKHACGREAGHDGPCRCFCGAELPPPEPPVDRTAHRALGSLDALFEGQRPRLLGYGGVHGGTPTHVQRW